MGKRGSAGGAGVSSIASQGASLESLIVSSTGASSFCSVALIASGWEEPDASVISSAVRASLSAEGAGVLWGMKAASAANASRAAGEIGMLLSSLMAAFRLAH